MRRVLVTLLCVLGLVTLASAQSGVRTDNSTYQSGVAPTTPMGALFQASPPAITDGNVGIPRMDGNRTLMINCISGCGGSGGTSFQDKNPVTAGTTSFTLSGGYRDDTATSTLAEDTGGIVRLTQFRAFHVNLRDQNGNEITALGGGGQTYGAAFPATGTAVGFSDGTNLQSGRVFDLDTGAGFQYVIGVNLRLSGAGGSTEVSSGTPLPITCISGCSGGGGGGTSSNFGAAFPAAGTAIGIFDGTNMRSAKAYDVDSGGALEHVMGVSIRMTANGGSTEPAPATPLPVAFYSGGSVVAPSAVDTDDGTIAGGQSNVTLVAGLNYLSDGTNWTSRQQQAAHGLNSTGGGILLGAIAGEFDDTSPTPITENQFGNLRISSNRNLYSTLRDAAGNERGANVNANNELQVAVASKSNKLSYAAASAITVTNLQSVASSATWVSGWESNTIDNSTNLYKDYRITAKIVVASSGLAAGEIRLYLVAEFDDSTYPDVFDGTESTETITSTQIRDAIAKFAAGTATDTTASRTYYLDVGSVKAVFGGLTPRKFVVYIAQSTGQPLAAAGNVVNIKGAFETLN